jgi:hypothetical protein
MCLSLFNEQILAILTAFIATKFPFDFSLAKLTYPNAPSPIE